MRIDRCAIGVNQGSNASYAARVSLGFGWQDGQASGPASLKETQKKGLGAIVGVVRRGDGRGTKNGGRVLEGAITGGARARLQIATGWDLHRGSFEGDVQSTRKGRGGIEFACGLGAKAVVDTEGEQAIARFFCAGEETHHVQQGHRIATATHRDDDSVTRCEKRRLRDGAPREGEQGRRVRRAR